MLTKIYLKVLLSISIAGLIFLLFTGLESKTLETGIQTDWKVNDTRGNRQNLYSKLFNSEEYITENQKLVDILHYDLYFDLYPENKRFIASASLTGRIIQEDIPSLDLNFYDNFNITHLSVNGVNSEYSIEEQKLSIKNITAIGDTFSLRIDYEGSPKRAGFAGFVFGKRNGTSLVYTLSEPNYASSWFPCNDLPNDKALMEMRIRNDSSRISVSNGLLKEVISEGSKKTYHWSTNYPISTYLIALYSADYSTFTDSYISIDGKDTMSIEYYVLPDKYEKAKVDFSEHLDMMRFFSETFGEYPFIKEKYGVAEFLWQMGAMEHQTITGVASNIIGGRKFFTDILAHELAHHWWGDAVGPKSWNDIWLNEGFSTYSEALFFEFRGGKSALESTMREKHTGKFRGKLSEPGDFLFTSTVYNKGAWVLHMLRWRLGDIIFFTILREFYQRFRYANASTEDFKEICEEVSGENLDNFFKQWIEGEGEIELEYAWRTIKNSDGYKTKLLIDQIQDEVEVYEFPLEVELVNTSGTKEYFRFEINSRQTVISIEHNDRAGILNLDPHGWLLVNINETDSEIE